MQPLFLESKTMDPTACYMILLEAIAERDYARAREYALILKNWLEGGGFYPKGYEVTDILETMNRVLRPARSASSLRFPFGSIVCMFCDAGSEIESLQQAIDEGWIKIDPTVDIPGATHAGVCPACRQKQDGDN
jgi:hypothetical protein